MTCHHPQDHHDNAARALQLVAPSTPLADKYPLLLEAIAESLLGLLAIRLREVNSDETPLLPLQPDPLT